ncbi:MAG: hypothetical protein WB784_03195 [Rhodanobacteraceae bacterium]
MLHRFSARMATWQIWLLCLSGALLWLSGVVWLLLHYFAQTAGEFGPQANPLESWMLRLHGFFLIPLLLGIGGLFIAHIPKGWQQHRQRVAGVILASLLGLLILSGYFLYYLGNESWRSFTSIAHWSIGIALPAVFLWHFIQGHRRRRHQRTDIEEVENQGHEARITV